MRAKYESLNGSQKYYNESKDLIKYVRENIS